MFMVLSLIMINEVSTYEALTYATKNRLIYIETSAKTGENIDALIEWLTKILQYRCSKRIAQNTKKPIKIDERATKRVVVVDEFY